MPEKHFSGFQKHFSGHGMKEKVLRFRSQKIKQFEQCSWYLQIRWSNGAVYTSGMREKGKDMMCGARE